MNRHLLLIFVIAALLSALASVALGEVKTEYTTQGNNVGAIIGTGYGGPFWGRAQFPRGSGNFYGTHDDSKWNKDSDDTRINWGVSIARDLNGDGVSDDTLYNKYRGAHIYGCNNSLESYDLLSGLYNAGNNMFEAASRAEVNRVYSSLDAEDLEAWPAEFREGRTANGEPILIGAETVCVRFGDAFHEAGDAMGVSMEYRFHMLNFGESNNMVYGHVFIRNMSEYNKWNPLKKYAAMMQSTPDGQVWNGWQYHFALTRMRIGARDEGWIINCPYNILGQVDRNNAETSFAGNVPAMIAQMALRVPSFKGESMELTNSNAMAWNCEYGYCDAPDVLETGHDAGESYRYGLGEKAGELSHKSNLEGLISPWTGRQAWGYPGIMNPGDSRYDKWMWGDRNSENTYMFWSELHNFAPRDSSSADFVLMFVMPPSGTWAMPRATMATLDDQTVQDHFAPILDYANVARLVYDGGLIVPETPATPPLTIVPGDRQVTLTWSDINFQTPDKYYYFLQEHPELDPNHHYKEYDMEGYRLYRSFVGPSDTHSELIFSCSKSNNNIEFYYLDSYEKDQPLYRMWNGKKVWYALVPFDKNYDTVTGGEFSLPTPTSGKTWNRPGQNLYTVIPRSEASDFKAAEVDGEIRFIAADGSTPESARNVVLSGPGDGSLTDQPVELAPLPFYTVEFIPVNNERLTAAKTVYLTVKDRIVYDQQCDGNIMAVENTLSLIDGSYETATKSLYGGGADRPVLSMAGPVDEAGINYNFDFTFDSMSKRGVYTGLYFHINLGGYTGGDVRVLTARGCGPEARPGTSPSNLYTTRAGRFQVTWKDAGGGNLTVEVKDLSRGAAALDRVDYPDEWGWGFQTKEGSGGDLIGNRGLYYDEAFGSGALPKSERTVKMASTMPADNTEQFGLFLNGILWIANQDGGDGITMPSAGTVWIIDNAFGYWDDDMKKFTQVPDMAFPGDKWEIKIKPSSLDPNNADLNLVSVVPNPYLASSVLDLSPDSRRIEFVNLPDKCTIRIYTLNGNLVNVLNHIGANRHGWGDYTDWDRLNANNQPTELTGYDNHGGSEPWNLRNRFGQTVASGLYFYVVTDSRGKKFTGKFYVVI